jgi:alpha-tubulin suppressor-like RCC1 family protein
MAAFGAALDAQGRIHAWGEDRYGMLSPPTGTGFVDVAVSAKHACALRADGEVECWGDNSYGQTSSLPCPFLDIEPGWRATCGVRTSGDVVCWGCIVDGFCDNDDM